MKPVSRITCHLVDLFATLKMERNLGWLFGMVYYILFKIKNNIKIFGLKKIPKNRNFILVGNHSSTADSYLLFALMHGRLRMPFWYITKITDRERRDPLFTRLLRLSGGIPREGSGTALVRWMAKVLVDPKRRRIAIPPEGMYNDGKLMEGFTGVVRVYHEANKTYKIPILPVVSIGAAEAYPTKPDADGKFRPKPHKGIIGRFGEPFHLEKPGDGNYTKEFLRDQVNIIMERIRKLMMQKETIQSNWKLDQVRTGQDGKQRVY